MKGLCGCNCDKCKSKKQCGGCSMCEASICGKCCGKCEAFCPDRYGNMEYCSGYLERLGGAEFYLNKNNDVGFDLYHIPIIPDRLVNRVDVNLMPVAGINGDRLLSSTGRHINKRYIDKGVHEALNIDAATKTIVELYIKDKKLEGLWINRNKIYKELKSIGIDIVIAPNFSIYEDAPRLEHLYNIKRTTIVYNEMIEAGISAIPDISYYSLPDLERWILEINKSDIKIISCSFQVVDIRLKASNMWKNYLTGFRYLCENISSDIKILIAGAISTRRITEIRRAASGQEIFVLNQSAYLHSRKGILSQDKTLERKLDKDELLKMNIDYYNNEYKY